MSRVWKVGEPCIVVEKADFHRAARVMDATVTKVGRKYLTATVEGRWDIEFVIASGQHRSEFSARYKLYAAREEYEQDTEQDRLVRALRQFCTDWSALARCDLPALREAVRVLEVPV